MRFYNKDQYTIDFFDAPRANRNKITMGEFFAGGGGWTSGCEALDDIETRWILNHDAIAVRTNAFHHKGVKVYWADFFTQDEHLLEQVDYIHASIECDEHSASSGRKKKNVGNYMMGWELVRYIKYLQPLVLSVENVPEYKKWAPLDENDEPIKDRKGEEFQKWKKAIMDMGYEYVEDIRNAADDGIAQRRKRFFCFFYRPGIDISFPEPTHNQYGTDGKKPWVPCRIFIDTNKEGVSIFGRKFNMNLRRDLRRPLVPNSLARIAAGMRKYSRDSAYFLTKYHAGSSSSIERAYSLDEPLRTADGSNRHQLVEIQGEKLKFIIDHGLSDHFLLNEAMPPQMIRQTKPKATVEYFICQYYGNIQHQTLDLPLNTQPCRDVHQLVRLEKLQFICQYFNSNGDPGKNIQSLDEPLSPVMTEFKHQLVTILDGFDIKVRFLDAEELAGCSSFAPGYFTHPDLKLSQKNAVTLIGNAVPPKWATNFVGHNIAAIKEYKEFMSRRKQA